jgi:hypothetical protein
VLKFIGVSKAGLCNPSESPFVFLEHTSTIGNRISVECVRPADSARLACIFWTECITHSDSIHFVSMLLGGTRQPSGIRELRHLMSQVLGLVSVIVRDYDEAIGIYVGVLGFDLIEDSPVPEQGKRWVVVRPPGAGYGGVLWSGGTSPRTTFVECSPSRRK